jgi:parallel beta-helix repeat protein
LQRDYYIIDGFVIDGEDCTQSQCIGVRIIGLGSDGTIIRNCTIQNHFTHGVQITRSTGVQVLDNTFYNNGNTDHRHGIYVAGIDEPSWCLIKGNKMYDNADGVSVGGQNAEWTVIIDGNLITGSTYMAIHLKQKARGCVIKNNVIFRQGSNPVFVHADENIITNNTIIQTNGKGIRLSSASNDNIVFNNIVVAESPASAIKDEGVSNRIHTASNIIHYAGEAGFRLDDLFVAPDRDDYHIKDGSEAHNAGTSAYLGVAATDSDFDGDLRPGGDAVDIGSDEISGRRERPHGGKDPFPHAHLMPVGQASLSQSYPNPFNPSTTIKFRVESPARVTLRIYDVTGRLIRTLVDEAMEGSAKERLAVWDGRNNDGVSVRSGVYFYRLAAGKRTETRKLLLVK